MRINHASVTAELETARTRSGLPVLYRGMLFLAAALSLAGCATPPLRGTGDLGVVIERAAGSVQVVDTTHRTRLGQVA
ncbi:MAG: hypothetical protein ACM3JK_05755, partial [Betaproteobacteria bacterium]